jgi:hypothetical protein
MRHSNAPIQPVFNDFAADDSIRSGVRLTVKEPDRNGEKELSVAFNGTVHSYQAKSLLSSKKFPELPHENLNPFGVEMPGVYVG